MPQANHRSKWWSSIASIIYDDTSEARNTENNNLFQVDHHNATTRRMEWAVACKHLMDNVEKMFMNTLPYGATYTNKSFSIHVFVFSSPFLRTNWYAMLTAFLLIACMLNHSHLCGSLYSFLVFYVFVNKIDLWNGSRLVLALTAH